MTTLKNTETSQDAIVGESVARRGLVGKSVDADAIVGSTAGPSAAVGSSMISAFALNWIARAIATA